MSLIFLLLELEVKELESTSFQECYDLFEWTLSQRKEVDIPLGNLPYVKYLWGVSLLLLRRSFSSEGMVATKSSHIPLKACLEGKGDQSFTKWL